MRDAPRRRRAGTLTAVLCAALAGAYGQNPEALARARQSYELARAGHLDRAAAVMREAIAIEPGNALLHSALAGILARQNKLDEAQASFEEAVRLDPAKPALRFQLAKLQAQTRHWEAARENLLRLLEQEPGNPDLLAMLEDVACELGAEWARARRYKAGQALAREAARRFPRSGRVYEMLGLFETRNQENVLAVEAYRKARELNPDSVGAVAGLAIAQSAAGMASDAVATLEAGLRQFPRNANLHQIYGILLLKFGETDPSQRAKGIARLEQALQLDPGLAEAQYQLGNLALAEGRAGEALTRLEAALKNGENSSRVWFALSRAYRRTGRGQEAESAMKRFRERKAAEEKGKP